MKKLMMYISTMALIVISYASIGSAVTLCRQEACDKVGKTCCSSHDYCVKSCDGATFSAGIVGTEVRPMGFDISAMGLRVDNGEVTNVPATANFQLQISDETGGMTTYYYDSCEVTSAK